LQYTAVRNSDTDAIITHLPTTTYSYPHVWEICEDCNWAFEGQVGAFSPDNEFWAVGFSEDDDEFMAVGGIAIYEVKTGEMVRAWRLSHPYFTNEEIRWLYSANVGGWDDEGILFFTWCGFCDGPLNVGYLRWNPDTDEVSPTGERYDSGDEQDTLATTGEVVLAATDRHFPYITEYSDLSNVVEYWAQGVIPGTWTDRPILFYDPAYNHLETPTWVDNGEAVYVRASQFALHPDYHDLLLYRDGRRIRVESVEPDERPLHGTPDGWLSVIRQPDGEPGQQLYRYVVLGEEVRREEFFFLEPGMRIVEIESEMLPAPQQAFFLAELPPVTGCYLRDHGTVESAFQTGAIGRVTGDSPAPMRDSPIGNKFAEIPVGAEFTVWDGAFCGWEGDGRWLVEYAGNIGWIGGRYWETGIYAMLEVVEAPALGGTCPGFLPSRLTVGGIGRVTPGEANNVRSVPSLEGRLVGQIPGEGVFEVLRGPICNDSFAYWKVNHQGAVIGWTSEGSGNTYWLEPVP
jgi:hypothetical protein